MVQERAWALLHVLFTSIVRMGSKMTGPVPEPMSNGMFMPAVRASCGEGAALAVQFVVVMSVSETLPCTL